MWGLVTGSPLEGSSDVTRVLSRAPWSWNIHHTRAAGALGWRHPRVSALGWPSGRSDVKGGCEHWAGSPGWGREPLSPVRGPAARSLLPT